MLVPTIVMAVLAGILLLVGYSRGHNEHLVGLKIAGKMVVEILPLLIFAFIVAGMVQVLLPRDLMARWIGTESGLRGIFLGALAGGLSPGGPYVSLPIVLTLMKAGASVGTLVAFLTGWSLWAVSRLPMEMGILGWKFALIRLLSTLIFPPLAGLLAQLLFGNVRL